MVAVIMAGRPLTFHALSLKMNAVLWAFHPGSMAGPAIADTLFGDSIPSGKLTVTFPRTVGQVPIYYNHMNTGRPADVLASTRDAHFSSKYIDVDFTPEYPFGFGLSYAHFQYSNLHLSSSQISLGQTLQASADITNTGQFAADEIVQLYIRQLSASQTQPVRELKGFSRLHLNPGETKQAKFSLAAAQLSFHNANGTLVTEPGHFQLWIAPDSASGLCGSFDLVH
jgi:beta-glucosidase